MDASLRTSLAAIVGRSLRPALTPDSFVDETPLLGGNVGMESLSVLEIIVAIEEDLGVIIEPEDVGPETFGTFGRLLKLVAGRRAPGAVVTGSRSA